MTHPTFGSEPADAAEGSSSFQGRRIHRPSAMLAAVALAVFEGADLASMGPTLTRITNDLGLDHGQAGLSASASLIGLIFGSVVGGRLADRIGRYAVLVVSALLLGIFSWGTAYAQSFESLGVIRFLAGLGMGGVLPIIIAIGRDSASPSFRSTAMGIIISSGSVGAIGIGFISLLPDWRYVFYVGGLGPLIVLPLLFLFRRSIDASGTVADVPAEPAWQCLFARDRIYGTWLIWGVNFCTVLASYIMINWLPSLLVLQGMGEPQSRLAAIIYGMGSIVGNFASGRINDRGRPQTAYVIGFAGAALSAVALASGNQSILFPAIFLSAICIIGSQLVTMTLTSTFYPDQSRGTGLGAMVAAGRVGSVTGPIVAGGLLVYHFEANAIFLFLVPILAIALALGLILVRHVCAGTHVVRESKSPK